MKIIIPSELQIGSRKIKIRISEKALGIADLQAQASIYEDILRLSLKYEGYCRSNAIIFENLLHEIVHFIDRLYMRELEERQVGALGSGLAQALMSMDIEPDFSQIPKESSEDC